MGVANKYNKTKMFNYTIPTGATYYSLSDLYQEKHKDKVYKVDALYINKKSRFGDSPIVASGDMLINLPSHLTETVKEMMNDDEVIDAVNDGKFGFEIYKYTTKNNTDAFSVNWVDINN